jgi:DNA gyrase/topoisomerase IV subunit B
MGKDSYTAKDIKILDDREHVRIRTALYLGSMEPTELSGIFFENNKIVLESTKFIPAVYKAVGEIIDNSIDEFHQVSSKKHSLVITADVETGKYTISDNGRGVPIDKHESGVYTPQAVFCQLRSGRNFKDEKKSGTIGQNGVGSSCVNFVSKEFSIKINRDSKEYTQIFENGAEKINKPLIGKGTKKTGTSTSFILDDKIFKDVGIPDRAMRQRAIEIAATNPSIKVEYNGEVFKYPKGFPQLVAESDTKNYHSFVGTGKDGQSYEYFVIFDVNLSQEEKIYTWVNSSLLFEGGSCNTQFMNAFVEKTILHLEKAAKKLKTKVTRNDVRDSLLVLGNIKISDPQYNSQSKLYLTGPSMRSELDTLINDGWSSFVRKNKSWFEDVLEKAQHRHGNKETKKALDDLSNRSTRHIENFCDITGRDRKKSSLFITEGLSASNQLRQVREPAIHGFIPLTGKINNVYGCSITELLKMGKVADLLLALGLRPGNPSGGSLRFGKVIIATDADPDGDDIFTLLVNLFYSFWPDMFEQDNPKVFRLTAPNIVASKGNKRVHFPTKQQYEEVKGKYESWSLEYYKGLGSMKTVDWKMIMKNLDDYLIPMWDDGKLKETLHLLFLKGTEGADNRKEWLQK